MNLRRPFTPGFADLLRNGQNTPALTPEDVQVLWGEGMMPAEFLQGPELEEIGRENDTARRVLAQEEDMRARLPETGEDIVRQRGAYGESFRTLLPNNLGNGAVMAAGSKNVAIVDARGLDCLTPVSAALGYNVMSPPLPTDDIFVQAHIHWGVGGAMHEAVVDVGRGTQIRLQAATRMQVWFDYLPDQSTTPPRTGPDICGIALLGYGIPAGFGVSSPARFTQRLATIAPGATSAIVPIPKFAISFGVIGESGSIAGSLATQMEAVLNDGNGHTAVSVLTDSAPESQFYIPNGMRAVQVTNGSGLAQKFNIVFTLSL